LTAPAGPPLAIVDLGSNSTRLFLSDRIGPEGPGGRRWTRVTALKRGAAPDGTIAPDALERTEACLAEYAERVNEFAPRLVLALGTSAVRDAPNGEAVAVMVGRHLGARLRILSGEEEAALAFRGARLALPGLERPVVVLDIGGGSTEIVEGGPEGPERAVSLQLGSVRTTDRHLHRDPPRPSELRAFRAEALALMRPVLAGGVGRAPMIGVAGTITSVASIRLGEWDPERTHRAVLGRGEVEATAERLAALPLERRREVPGLDPERAPSIVGGAMILAAALEAAGVERITVSERDLLDGAVLDAESLAAPVAG
jgi:exopolyphosphatase/guanosine-5'-triphosphate,3'-diphosphate pyrophosphatase